ncbi:MAG: RNA polymerase sigma factor [Acidimicrobiales bacterium]
MAPATIGAIGDTLGYEAFELTTESNAALYRKHATELTQYATMLVGPDDAADVVANAVLSCMSSRSWQGVANPRAYLFRATQREAHRVSRSRWRRRSAEERAGPLSAVDPPSVRDTDITSALQRLSLRQRGIVYLTYWEDRSPQQIAALLGISEGAIKRHLARARAQLREVLDDHR